MEDITIYGIVTAADSGETLPGATIYESDANGNPTGSGTTSNDSGDFTLKTKAGKQISVRLIGYKGKKFTAQPGKYYIQLEETATELKPVTVTAPKKDRLVQWLIGIALLLGLATHSDRRDAKK